MFNGDIDKYSTLAQCTIWIVAKSSGQNHRLYSKKKIKFQNVLKTLTSSLIRQQRFFYSQRKLLIGCFDSNFRFFVDGQN